MSAFRIESPLRVPSSVEPAELQETDFVRWGEVQRSAHDHGWYQNARLLLPLTAVRGTERVVYPVNSYIRVYELLDGTCWVGLISATPLPATMGLPLLSSLPSTRSVTGGPVEVSETLRWAQTPSEDSEDSGAASVSQ